VSSQVVAGVQSEPPLSSHNNPTLTVPPIRKGYSGIVRTRRADYAGQGRGQDLNACVSNQKRRNNLSLFFYRFIGISRTQ